MPRATNAHAHSPAVAAAHDAAVAEIVVLIREKYEDQGERNFAIGKRAFEHAQWQRGNFPAYQATDFDALMDRIRDDVLPHVPIAARSIRVAYWVRTHVLRDLVRQAIGPDLADRLAFFEYLALTAKALEFDKKGVEGSLVPGWMDLIRDIANERMSGRTVSSREFLDRVGRNAGAIKEARGGRGPTDPAKAKARKAAKARGEIAACVAAALAAGHVTPSGVLGILEAAARERGVPMPAWSGWTRPDAPGRTSTWPRGSCSRTAATRRCATSATRWTG